MNYKEQIFSSYSSPLISSGAIKMMVSEETNLGAFNVHTTGPQALLIGFFFLVLSFITFYYLLIKIPKNIGENKVQEILGIFFKSPFFITWMMCIFFSIFNELIPLGTFIFLGMLIVCFYFQRKFNKKLIEIYNQ